MYNWIVDKFEWRTIAVVLNSPVTKAVALIPVFGYLIIFNQEITCWLNRSILGEWYVFSPIMKFRLVYYGGLSLVVALLIYNILCPRALKRYASCEDAVEAYYEGSRPKIVKDIIERHIRESHQGFRFGLLGLSVLVRHPRTFKRLTAAVSYYLASAPSEELSFAGIRKASSSEDACLTWFTQQDPDRLRELLAGVYQKHVRSPQKIELNSLGEQIVQASFDLDQRRSPFMRSIAAVLAYLGALFILAPAAETFIHVVFIDLVGAEPPVWLSQLFEWDANPELCEADSGD